MDMNIWPHVLRLMGLVIVADKRIYQEEVETFVEQSLLLHAALTPDMLFTRKMAFDWFVSHRDELDDIIKSPECERRVIRLILSIGECDDLHLLLNAMWAVSASDGEYHSSEVHIAALAAAYWNLPIPEITKKP